MALLLSTETCNYLRTFTFYCDVMCHYLRNSNLHLLLSTGEYTSGSKDVGCVDEADLLGKNYTSLNYSDS